jgi:hypothetical protein
MAGVAVPPARPGTKAALLAKESNVLATGGLLVCIALLTLAAVAPAFRSDNPPRWTTYGWVGEVVTLAIVSTLAIGVGYVGAGAIDAAQTGVDYLDLGLLAGVLLVAAVIWRQWKARARAKSLGAEATGPRAASAPPPPRRAA